jgi:alcohol dehydrogenase
VDASGDPEVLQALLERTGPAGHCTSTSALFHVNRDVPFPTRKLYRNSITYSTGWVHTRTLLNGTDNPLDLLAGGKLDPAPVTSALVDWSRADEALSAPFVKVIATRH